MYLNLNYQHYLMKELYLITHISREKLSRVIFRAAKPFCYETQYQLILCGCSFRRKLRV